MDSVAVQQLEPLSEFFKFVLERCLPPSVAILGVAGGNGLEQIDTAVTKRIVGVDVNKSYLEEVKRRFGPLPGLELYCGDLNSPAFQLPPVLLVHAALIFEHVGLNTALDNALSLVAPGGAFSVVLQLPSEQERAVAPTGYTSMQALADHFQFIDRH